MKTNNIDEINQRAESSIAEYILELKDEYNKYVSKLGELEAEYSRTLFFLIPRRREINKEIKDIKQRIVNLSLRINSLESELK